MGNRFLAPAALLLALVILALVWYPALREEPALPTPTAPGGQEDGKQDGGEAGAIPVEQPAQPDKDRPAPVTKRPLRTRTSRWDPPGDLGHLPGTPESLRKRIDKLVDQMMSTTSKKAAQELAEISKPAFPLVLAAIARVRDGGPDVASLRLADECLREMDGWLDAKGKLLLRSTSDKDYVAYICRLHYKRWLLYLRDMRVMPGPFHPRNARYTSWNLDGLLKRLKARPNKADVVVEETFFWFESHTIIPPPDDVLEFFASLPSGLEQLCATKEQRHAAGLLLVEQLTNPQLVLRKTARDCLRALYDHTLYYSPDCPIWRREQKREAWAAAVEARREQ